METRTTQTGVPRLIFDKYEIVQRLAVGGMGEVFFAVQHSDVEGFARPVILKSLLPDLAERDDLIEQFLDEARVAATLNHPNVVSIYEVGQWEGDYFIAMEFIRGRNLSQMIRLSVKKNITISPAVIAQVIRDAALGLDHAHQAKNSAGEPAHIVHRDVSPKNVMVREDGVTKVVDFGIARANNRSSRTATGTLKGPLINYMAPEQIRQLPLTGQCDQFSLGIVMWELCTRQSLFRTDGDLSTVMQILEQPIPKVSQVVPGLPEELDDIVLRMLQRDPSRRYANCAEVARDLEMFRSKFSPATAESPAALLMKQLGLDDLATLPPRSTPSKRNFLIDLRAANAPQEPPPVERLTQQISSDTAIMTTPVPSWMWPLAVVLALATVVVATIVWRSTKHPIASSEETVVTRVYRPDDTPTVLPPASVVSPDKPLFASLEIRAQPPQTLIRINNGPPQTAPLAWEGEPAELTISAEATGYASQIKQFAPTAGVKDVIEFILAKKESPVPMPTSAAPASSTNASGDAFLTVSTTPDTNLWVDDRYIGLTPVSRQVVPSGRHVITLRNDEAGILIKKQVVLKPGRVFKINDQLK